jgi:hypothetical protein
VGHVIEKEDNKIMSLVSPREWLRGERGKELKIIRSCASTLLIFRE